MIRQRIAEKKETAGPVPTTSPPVEPAGDGDGPQDGNGPLRLAEIKRKLNQQKKNAASVASQKSDDVTLLPTTSSSSPPPALPPRLNNSVTPPIRSSGGNDDDDDAPPVPPRTAAMLVEIKPPCSDPLKRKFSNKNYLNVSLSQDSDPQETSVKKKAPKTPMNKEQTSSDGKKKYFLFAKVKQPSSPKKKGLLSSPKKSAEQSPKSKGKKSPEKQKTVTTHAKFLNMSIRPLPELPGRHTSPEATPDHTEDDYEEFDLGTVQDDMYINNPQFPLSPWKPPLSDPAVRRWSAIGSKDIHSVNRPRLNSPAGALRAKNTESSDIMGSPGSPDSPEIPDLSDDYDYPDIRSAGIFRSMESKKAWLAKIEQRREEFGLHRGSDPLHSGALDHLSALKNDNQELGLHRTTSTTSADYVPMDSARDDTYINYDTRGNGTELSPRGQPRSDHDTEGDITVYMNLPTPEKGSALPPREYAQEAVTLPRSKSKTKTVPPPPVLAKPRIARESSDSTREPPSKLPKPQRSSAASTTKVSGFHEDGVPPTLGWKLHPQGDQSQSPSPDNPDYANFDGAQTLPSKVLSSAIPASVLEKRRVSEGDTFIKLPPRDIPRQLK